MRYVGVGSFHTGGREAATKFLYVITVTIGDTLYKFFFLSTLYFKASTSIFLIKIIIFHK